MNSQRFRGLPPLRSGDPRKGEAESKKNTGAAHLCIFCFLAFANVFATLKNKKCRPLRAAFFFGGEWGIRTRGPLTVNSFQDCRNRPLCQLSAAKVQKEYSLANFFC